MTATGAGRWLPRLGLRPRLAIALAATSVATLAAATLTIAPLLAKRLESERLADLRGLARSSAPALRAIPDDDLHPRARALRVIASQLARRAGGRIVIYDEAGRVLADTSSADAGREPVVPDLAAERARALRRRDDVASGTYQGRAFAILVTRDEATRITLVIAKRLDDTRAALGVIRGALPLGLLAGLLVGALLALLLSRSMLRRLATLYADARALRDEGLGHEVTVAGGDEVAVVARALEEMRARLVEEESSRQAFVATASHELRTPLASLQATLELLKEEVLRGGTSPQETAGRADTALRQTHRLVGLATDLLDLSRVEGGDGLHPEPLELGELAETIAPEFEARLLAADRSLHVRVGPALALADPAAAVRVLRILLDNACNYGEGAVTVTVHAETDAVVVAVADEGPGVAEAEREDVFRRFARGRAAPGTPGAGLGLAIARALAEAQGGTLATVQDGVGAVFAMRLPPWRGTP
ncbi:HAMP domain-containing histidine kinase [Baekduia soli]|uniref:Signal transduction histidine-protein kinase/phosphatase MprB n=1 Tax=Baekduia soli TaxID=496014 RepID=A0A5B8UBH3_9ACTN|nr:HAMP domain-containing sensor histidine kinase [Baekduia soli]QEC50344.1 HAMP domain-containing histidine kinase [Baekduia soli]